MSRFIFEELCDYIDRIPTDELIDRREKETQYVLANGFDDFRFAYFKYFSMKKDYLRLIRHAANGGGIGG